MFAAIEKIVSRWVSERFGPPVFEDTHERVMRILEEAIELAQTEDVSRDMAHKLVDYVFNKPVGESKQETAGVLITLLAYTAAKGIDLKAVTTDELARIHEIEPSVVQKKQRDKALAGIGISPQGLYVGANVDYSVVRRYPDGLIKNETVRAKYMGSNAAGHHAIRFDDSGEMLALRTLEGLTCRGLN